MEQQLPKFIRPINMARQRKTIFGIIAISKLNRINDLLIKNTGNITVSLLFFMEKGQPMVNGDIQGTVFMRCERCLHATEISLQNNLSIGFVENIDNNQLPDNYEPFLITNGQSNLHIMIEEEILLALPMVAYHQNRKCNPKLNYDNTALEFNNLSNNPFKQLIKLKVK